MKSKLVRSTFDINNPPPLTDQQRAELERLAAMSDDDIDYSDIPPVDFSNAVRWRDRHLYKPVREPTPVPIDPDVLSWLRTKGKGYEVRLNAILREAMLRDAG